MVACNPFPGWNDGCASCKGNARCGLQCGIGCGLNLFLSRFGIIGRPGQTEVRCLRDHLVTTIWEFLQGIRIHISVIIIRTTSNRLLADPSNISLFPEPFDAWRFTTERQIELLRCAILTLTQRFFECCSFVWFIGLLYKSFLCMQNKPIGFCFDNFFFVRKLNILFNIACWFIFCLFCLICFFLELDVSQPLTFHFAVFSRVSQQTIWAE